MTRSIAGEAVSYWYKVIYGDERGDLAVAIARLWEFSVVNSDIPIERFWSDGSILEYDFGEGEIAAVRDAE